ncbi:unnamed protein product, partial [Heterosigma akashiwo]
AGEGTRACSHGPHAAGGAGRRVRAHDYRRLKSYAGKRSKPRWYIHSIDAVPMLGQETTTTSVLAMSPLAFN